MTQISKLGRVGWACHVFEVEVKGAEGEAAKTVRALVRLGKLVYRKGSFRSQSDTVDKACSFWHVSSCHSCSLAGPASACPGRHGRDRERHPD